MKVLFSLKRAQHLLCFRKRKELFMRQITVKKLALSAMFLALAFLMPFLTGQIPEIGSMLCPMHIPVIICGFICGAPYGLAVGFIAPLLRSALLGMPPLFPVAFAMAFELAVYGFVSGFLYQALPRKKLSIFISLIAAMLSGRIVWGLVQFFCLGLNASKFGFAEFWAGAVANALPGIILQIVLIPLIIAMLEKAKILTARS